MQRVLLAGVAAQLPWLMSCTDEETDPKKPLKLSWQQAILDQLLPHDDYGPGAVDFYADKYIEWYLQDELVDPVDRQFVAEGFEKFEAEFDTKEFTKLSFKERSETIQQVYETNWGKSWLSRIMTLCFEAMLTHPIYEGNPKGIGWEWLDHTPGQPEPTAEIKYPQILDTIHES